MYNFYNGAEVKHSAESENNFRNEWKEIIDACSLILASLHGLPSTSVGDKIGRAHV